MDKIEEKVICKHQYVVDYRFRMPMPFFRNLLCDKCGAKIKLMTAWRILKVNTEDRW